jgi:hypothetical protein
MTAKRLRAWGLPEADRRLDVVAQQRLAGFQVAGEQAFAPVLQQRRAEGRIARDAGLDRLLEVACQGHGFQVSRRLRRL